MHSVVRILGAAIHVSAPAPLLDDLRTVFPPFPPPSRSTAQRLRAGARFPAARLSVRPGVPGPGWHRIERQDHAAHDVPPGESLLGHCEWAINTAAVEALAARYALFHAGAVALGAHGILFPAAHGAGKTTLVAALAGAGFSYFGDDIAVVDPQRLLLLPYPKSACVKRGSRDALLPWYPHLDRTPPRARFGDQQVWYVSPRPDAWPAAPVEIRHVILPRYVPGARTEIAPASRSTALGQLLEQSFSGERHRAAGVATAVALLRGAECHTLTLDRPDEAVDAITSLVSRAQSA